MGKESRWSEKKKRKKESDKRKKKMREWNTLVNGTLIVEVLRKIKGRREEGNKRVKKRKKERKKKKKKVRIEIERRAQPQRKACKKGFLP